MKIRLILCMFFFTTVLFAHEEKWGKTGHRTTGEIASFYLTDQAKKEINKILDGDGLALVSTFGDEIKSDPRYRKYSAWHYVNIPFGKTYKEIEKSPKGDLITGIRKCIDVLKNEESSKEKKTFYLKLLVHFIGDLHQPLHMGLEKDRGGNDFYVEWFGEDSNLHRVWDSEMINSYQMSYSELAENQAELTKSELRKMRQGSLLEWGKESRNLVKEIYQSVEEGDKLGYKYMYEWFPVVRQQLQKGGVRLAVILNEIYG